MLSTPHSGFSLEKTVRYFNREINGNNVWILTLPPCWFTLCYVVETTGGNAKALIWLMLKYQTSRYSGSHMHKWKMTVHYKHFVFFPLVYATCFPCRSRQGLRFIFLWQAEFLRIYVFKEIFLHVKIVYFIYFALMVRFFQAIIKHKV